MRASRKRTSMLSPALKAALALACVSIAAGARGAHAYFTDVDTTVNRFTVVPALAIAVVEERWSQYPDSNGNGIPDHAEELVPLQSVVKDPAIKNCAGTQAWIFAEIAVPTHNAIVVMDDHSLSLEPVLCELFVYELNEGWIEIEEASYDAERQFTVHRYAWHIPVDTGASTETLFDSVTLANIADNQLDDLIDDSTLAFPLDINGIGIQTEGFASWADAWAAYCNPEQET